MILNIFTLKMKKEDDDEFCKTTNCLDKLFKLITDHGQVKQGEYPIYNLVLGYDDFNNSLLWWEEQGYEPAISHVCCKLTNTRFKFDKLKLIVRTQNLISNELEGSVCAHDEETYNKLNKATNTLREQLFQSEHLS